jgi:hypothetical protein
LVYNVTIRRRALIKKSNQARITPPFQAERAAVTLCKIAPARPIAVTNQAASAIHTIV